MRAGTTGTLLALGLLLVSGTTRADEAPAAAVSATPRVETKPRTGLLIGGGITFGFAYGLTLIGTKARSEDHARDWLYVPVAGPWVFLANKNECQGLPSGCVDDWATTMVFSLFGVMQAVGAGLIASGFLFPTEHVVTGDSGAQAQHVSPVPTWAVTPAVVGQSGLGVAAAGTLF
jgi:hypothetical protein